MAAVSAAFLFSCASPQERAQHDAQLHALRSLKPITSDPKNAVRPIKRPDSDLLRALENMKPLTGVIWSWPKPSIEIAGIKRSSADPYDFDLASDANRFLATHELTFWVKESIAF